MERRQARRRTLRRRARWCLFWGIDVSSSDRCLENCPRGPGGAFARTQIRVAGHAVAHAAPATIWRDRNFAKPISAPLAKSGRIATGISVGADQRFRKASRAMVGEQLILTESDR